MATKPTPPAYSFEFAPIKTTRQAALASAAYRRITAALKDSGDDVLQMLAEDGVAVWNYIEVLAHLVKSSVNIGDLGSGGEALLEGFNRWLELPTNVTNQAVTGMLAASRQGQDAESAPPDTLTPAEKN